MINILLSTYSFHEEWARDKVAKYINNDDKVVIVPFSFSEERISNEKQWQEAYNREDGKYYNDVVEPFITLGIKEENIIWLNFFKDSNEDMKRIVKESNIIFFTGGMTEMAVKRTIETGIHNIIDDSKVVIGASAGALMQLENYFGSPDEEYEEFRYYEGLGLIKDNFYIEVHYADTKAQNESIEKALREKTEVVYAIKDDGGIVIDNGNLSLMGNVVIFEKKLD